MDKKNKSIELKPQVNKINGQIKFELKKRLLPKEIVNKLPRLKSLRLNFNNLKFENDFEGKWDD